MGLLLIHQIFDLINRTLSHSLDMLSSERVSVPFTLQFVKQMGRPIRLPVDIGIAAILCLHTALVLFHVSAIPSLICPMYQLFRVATIPRLIFSRLMFPHLIFPHLMFPHLICSMSYIFRVSRFRPFPNSQIMSQLQAPSWNQSCSIRVET